MRIGIMISIEGRICAVKMEAFILYSTSLQQRLYGGIFK